MGVREQKREIVRESVPSESDGPDSEAVVDPASASQPTTDASLDRKLKPPRWLPLVRPVALVVFLASIAAALFVAPELYSTLLATALLVPVLIRQVSGWRAARPATVG